MGDLEFFPNYSEFLLVDERASSGDNAEQGEKDDEGERLDIVVVAEYPGDVVVENTGDEQEEPAANENDVRGAGSNADQGGKEDDERADDENIVDYPKGGLRTNKERGNS